MLRTEYSNPTINSRCRFMSSLLPRLLQIFPILTASRAEPVWHLPLILAFIKQQRQQQNHADSSDYVAFAKPTRWHDGASFPAA